MKNKNILLPTNTILIVIDVQEKLLPSISGYKEITNNISRLIRGFKLFNVPILLTEQYPKGLGNTVPEIKKELSDISNIEKLEFSCFQNDEFINKIKEYENIKNIVVCGIETHVCVLQTCLDSLKYGYNTHVIIDAVSSRKIYDNNTALDKMKICGVLPSTVEIALFELTEKAKSENFSEISKIAKEFTNEKKIGFQK